jgi:putative lipoprotein
MGHISIVGSLFILIFCFFTVGCSNQNSELSSKDISLSTSTTSNERQSEESKKDYKDLYKSVFDDYQKIFSTSNDSTAISNLYQSLKATERPINSWSIENAINRSDDMRYSFVDLNDDGVEELLIADLNLSGKYFLTGVYSLQESKPVLLAEGFVAGHGGARNAAIIYQGGEILELSWSSGTGKGYGALYKLNENQKGASKLQEKEFQIESNYIGSNFGKTESDQIDLRGFDWQKFETSTSSSISEEKQKAPWNASKSAKLEAFIKGWGERLGQPNYKKGISGGDVGADNLYSFGDGPSEKMNAEYTDTGLGNAKYRIVERYSNWDKYPDVHSYFFAITDTGEAIVFHSPTTNGGVMYLKPTENTEIQAEFKRLVEEE